MEPEPVKPVRPIRPTAPAEISTNGAIWVFGSVNEEGFATYKNDSRDFHITIKVKTGSAAHASPEGGTLHGTALHVYESYVDNHVQGALQGDVDIWLNQQAEMQEICRQFRKKWSAAKSEMLAAYRKEKAKYAKEFEVHESWRLKYHPTPEEVAHKKTDEERGQAESRRLIDNKLRNTEPVKILDLSDGLWIVNLPDGHMRKLPASVFFPAMRRGVWTDEARELAVGKNFVLGSLDGRLFICSSNAMKKNSKKVDPREEWIASLPMATLDPDGYFRHTEGSYKAPARILSKIPTLTVDTGQEGCFRIRINDVTTVVWPGHPELNLVPEDTWIAWTQSLPWALVNDSIIVIYKSPEIADIYLMNGPLPNDEPAIGTEGCCLILNEGMPFVINYLDEQYFKKTDAGSMRSEWIQKIPKGILKGPLSNGLYEIAVNGGKYRIIPGRDPKETLESLSKATKTGTKNCFSVKYKNTVYVLDPDLGARDGNLVSLADWISITRQLPKGYLRKKAGQPTVLSAAIAGETEQSWEVVGKLPPSYFCSLTPDSYYIEEADTIVNVNIQSASFKQMPRRYRKGRKEWLFELPRGIYESPQSIIISGVKYRIPEGRQGEYAKACAEIPIGTQNCYMLRGEGNDWSGPVKVGDASFPLVPWSDWEPWIQSMETAFSFRSRGSQVVIPYSTKGLIYTVSEDYKEPRIGTPGCLSFWVEGRQFAIDPNSSYVTSYGSLVCNLIARLDSAVYLVSSANDCTWESGGLAEIGAVPANGILTLLLERTGDEWKWGELFVTSVKPLDYQSWIDGLEVREDTVFVTEPSDASPLVQVGQEEFAVVVDTSDPLDCLTNVWFRAKYKDDQWIPVRFADLYTAPSVG